MKHLGQYFAYRSLRYRLEDLTDHMNSGTSLNMPHLEDATNGPRASTSITDPQSHINA